MRKDRVDLWEQIIRDDEFSDLDQNASKPEEIAKVQKVLDTLRGLGPLVSPKLNVGCGGGSQKDFDHFLDPSEIRAPGVTRGWMEDLPFDDCSLGYIECWGTWGFLRSHVESIMEVSRCLKLQGSLVLDVFTYSTMPIAQTVNGPSFLRWVQLFGFSVQGYIDFGYSWHKRLGVRLKKIREFDPAFFRMPQVVGEIRNFVEERDWYMV